VGTFPPIVLGNGTNSVTSHGRPKTSYHVFQDMTNPKLVRIHYICPCCEKSVILTTTKEPNDDYSYAVDVCNECYDGMSEPGVGEAYEP